MRLCSEGGNDYRYFFVTALLFGGDLAPTRVYCVFIVVLA